MSAGVGDDDAAAVFRPGNRPGIRRSAVDVVEQHRIDQAKLGQVDQAERIAVNPPTFHLSGRQVKARHLVRHRGQFAVRGNAKATEQTASVGQNNLLEHPARRRLDHGNGRRHKILVRRPRMEMIGHQQMLAVASHVASHRFARNAHPVEFAAAAQVESGNGVLETEANIERASIRTEDGRHGGVTRRVLRHNRTLSRIDDNHGALRRCASDIKPPPIRGQRQAQRRIRHGQGLRHHTSGGVEDRHLVGRGISDEQRFAIGRARQRGRREVGPGSGLGWWRRIGGLGLRHTVHRRQEQEDRNQVGKLASHRIFNGSWGSV